MELNEILSVALRGGASDIHLKAGLPPMFRVDGSLVPLKDARRLPPEEIGRMAFGIMNDYQKEKFKAQNELDLAYGVPGLGRFRVNVFQQRGTIGVVLRVIPFKISSIEQLMLPKVLEKIAAEQRGLILVTGTTGSGKSTTLAAMIDHINSNETCHIMTIEDPIEFLIRDKRSIVNQREVGVDTLSFAHALKSSLRQDPDVILVGEMRDLETIETALAAAETGHLVLSTLHTLDATESIARIVSAFPPHQQKQVRLQLGSVLRAVVSQRLVPKADGKGRVAAIEVLVVNGRVREMVEDKDRTKEIPTAIAQSYHTYGMQTFDQSLMSLLKQQLITHDEALRQSSNPDDFALRVSGISATSDSSWDDFEQKDQPIPSPIPMPSKVSNPKLPAAAAVSSAGRTPVAAARRPLRARVAPSPAQRTGPAAGGRGRLQDRALLGRRVRDEAPVSPKAPHPPRCGFLSRLRIAISRARAENPRPMPPTFVRTRRTPMKTSRGRAGRAGLAGAEGRERDGKADKPEKAPRPARPEPTATEQALRLIAFRSRTARELDQALAKRKVPPDERAGALARMRELGYIDDVSLAGARARTLIGKGDSPRLVARRLQMQGIAQESAQAAAKDAAEGASDDELAVRALEKKLRGRPVRDEKDRQRLMRNLVSHGHRPSSVARALKLELNGSESGETDGDDAG